MSDIIKDAKQLLDGATPAPWEWFGYSIESEHGMVLDFQCVTEFGMNGASRDVEVTPEDERLIAAAPDLAQALAEETWEYSFQILRRDEWEHASDRIPGVDEWFPSKYVADFIMDAAQKSGYVCRLVRRRVSPVEIVNE